MSVPSAAAPVRSRTNPPKEVYETGSAPVTGPLVVKAAPVESSGKVSEPSISVSVAKEKFSAAQLNTDHQNYSGALGPKMMGPYLGSSPFELEGMGPSRPAETRFQRFQRLQADVRALMDEVEAEAKSNSDALRAAKEEPLPSYVHKELRALHLQLERAMGDESTRAVLTPSSGSFLALSNSVEDTVSRAMAAVHPAGDVGGSAITYELYAVPSSREGAIAALERRLARLEQFVGVSIEGLSLWDEVQALKSALELLEASRLEEMATKLRGAAESIANYERERRINPSASAASVASPVITEAQVASLLETVERWDAFASALPTVVGRLRSLRELHEDAAQFSQSLARVEAEQSAIKQLLDSGIKSLQEVQSGFAANAGAMKNNIDAIQKRVDVLLQAKPN